MTEIHIPFDRTTVLTIKNSGNTFFVDTGIDIHVTDATALDITASAVNTAIHNNGTIWSDRVLSKADAVSINAASASFTNEDSGTVKSDGTGLHLHAGAKDASIINTGTISAGDDGIYSEADGIVTLVNSGTIAAGGSAIAFNTGLAAIGMVKNNGTLSNSGKTAIQGGPGSDTVQNSGTITGDVNLSSGNDTFIAGLHSKSGTVFGGEGDDHFVIHRSGIKIVELAGQGKDWLTSDISHGLEANIEDMELKGTAAINATGNSLANKLTGNSAINIMKGGGKGDSLYGYGGNDRLFGESGTDLMVGGKGNDYLSGGSGKDTLHGGIGNDTLRGGTASDVFVFFDLGSKNGTDHVLDFDAKGSDHDFVMLENFQADSITKAELFAHLSQVGSDVVLDFGTDGKVIFDDIKLADMKHYNLFAFADLA